MSAIPNDDFLVSSIGAGSQSAMRALVERHEKQVLAFAFRMTGDLGTAEDIVQEAFLRVWRSAGKHKPAGEFRAWFHRIVVNLCVDNGRKRKLPPADLVDVIDESAAPPLQAAQARERSEAVRKAVDRLPERQRVVLVLHRFSGLPIRRIAETTGWSESAVESLLMRAYEELRRLLKKAKNM